MSEVVVRMEMPTGCANCSMADDDSRFCKAAKEYIPMLGKPSWCPIIGELPEQHGRLVDADDVNNHIIGYVDLRGCPTIVPATEGSETNGNAD